MVQDRVLPGLEPRRILKGAIAVALLVLGCSEGESDKTPTTTESGTTAAAGTPETAVAPPAGGSPGVLAGRAVFEGTVPPPRRVQVNKDESLCKAAEGERQDVVVSNDNGLAGAVVEIEGIPRSRWKLQWQEPEGGYGIHQKDCRFAPHLLVILQRAELTIYNDDPVTHNINSGYWNFAQTAADPPIKQTIRYVGRPFTRLNCNIHSWMEAWLYVARSPYHAVTGADGRFRIEGVPPGSYKVTASHPTLGTERFRIEVGSRETVEQLVRFRSP